MGITRAEQNVKIASDMYEARRAAKFLLGASYTETLRPYRDFIGRVMTDEGLPMLRAALKVGRSIPESDAIPLMCVMAAAVEMIESPQSADAVDPHVEGRESRPRAKENTVGSSPAAKEQK